MYEMCEVLCNSLGFSWHWGGVYFGFPPKPVFCMVWTSKHGFRACDLQRECVRMCVAWPDSVLLASWSSWFANARASEYFIGVDAYLKRFVWTWFLCSITFETWIRVMRTGRAICERVCVWCVCVFVDTLTSVVVIVQQTLLFGW